MNYKTVFINNAPVFVKLQYKDNLSYDQIIYKY